MLTLHLSILYVLHHPTHPFFAVPDTLPVSAGKQNQRSEIISMLARRKNTTLRKYHHVYVHQTQYPVSFSRPAPRPKPFNLLSVGLHHTQVADPLPIVIIISFCRHSTLPSLQRSRQSTSQTRRWCTTSTLSSTPLTCNTHCRITRCRRWSWFATSWRGPLRWWSWRSRLVAYYGTMAIRLGDWWRWRWCGSCCYWWWWGRSFFLEIC